MQTGLGHSRLGHGLGGRGVGTSSFGGSKSGAELEGSMSQREIPPFGVDGVATDADARQRAAWRGAGRVLVVDDEPSVARLTALVLDQHGFEVEVAVSGHDALTQIGRSPSGFRLVVVDLSMPDLSGVDVLRQARALGCPAPMVLTSGHSRTDTVSAVRDVQFAGYLQKPYRLETLLDVIQDALSQHDSAVAT
jgi:CheY-like chemotaxis protein